jgi:23S rRNA (adenine2030-N6)-methyltransferase
VNYRHLYHAGSFSDLMKHLILISIIEKMKEKPTNFSVLDAFGGLGIYDLSSEEALRTREYSSGIGLLQNPSSSGKDSRNNLLSMDYWPNSENNDIFQIYFQIINDLNKNSSNFLYPGSPYIISELLRGGDSLIACELHKEDYALLKKNITYPVHNIDAYNAIKAFLPPKTTRGLIVLDPAFEVKDEFSKIILAMQIIRKRFLAGIVMIWYPIKDQNIVKKFYNDLKSTGYSEFLKIEFEVEHPDLAMNKCGVVIANPPHIYDRLKLMMHFLCNLIYDDKAKYNIELI